MKFIFIICFLTVMSFVSKANEAEYKAFILSDSLSAKKEQVEKKKEVKPKEKDESVFNVDFAKKTIKLRLFGNTLDFDLKNRSLNLNKKEEGE